MTGPDSVLGFLARNAVVLIAVAFIAVWRLTVARQEARAEQAKEDGTWTPKTESRQAWLLLFVYIVGIGLFLTWVLTSLR